MSVILQNHKSHIKIQSEAMVTLRKDEFSAFVEAIQKAAANDNREESSND